MATCGNSGGAAAAVSAAAGASGAEALEPDVPSLDDSSGVPNTVRVEFLSRSRGLLYVFELPVDPSDTDDGSE